MLDIWKRLTPHQLRWLAIAAGLAFLFAVLLSDFFELLPDGFGFAVADAELRLFGREVPCPPRMFTCRVSRTVYALELPIRWLAVAAVCAAASFLYIASSRERQISD